MIFKIRNVALIGTTAAVIVALSIGGYLYFRANYATKPAGDIDFLAEVGKLIELPAGENPTIATISDITKFAGQPFFQKAKNGDKVLIYTNAKKAILYDPVAHRIIDVAPINTGTSSAKPAFSAKITLRNATQTVGLAGKMEGKLKKDYPDINIVSKDNAVTADFNKTLVVVLNDTAKDQAEILAKSLKAEIGNLPTGETRPKNSDILIILGKDSTI